MLVYHATHRSKLHSIRKSGLRRQYAQQKRKAVWLCSADRVGWAVRHALARHQCRPEDIVVLRLDVPADWLMGYRHAGLFYAERDVPAATLRAVIGYQACELKEG